MRNKKGVRKIRDGSKLIWLSKTTVIFINRYEIGWVTDFDGTGSGDFNWFSFDDPDFWMPLLAFITGMTGLGIAIYDLFS